MYPTLTDNSQLGGPSFPGFMYLPGEAVTALPHPAQVGCSYCDNPMSERGTVAPATGRPVPQHPATGDHDGVVSFIYCPATRGKVAECDFAHLRCVLDSDTVLTVGGLDPMALAQSWQDQDHGVQEGGKHSA